MPREKQAPPGSSGDAVNSGIFRDDDKRRERIMPTPARAQVHQTRTFRNKHSFPLPTPGYPLSVSTAMDHRYQSKGHPVPESSKSIGISQNMADNVNLIFPYIPNSLGNIIVAQQGCVDAMAAVYQSHPNLPHQQNLTQSQRFAFPGPMVSTPPTPAPTEELHVGCFPAIRMLHLPLDSLLNSPVSVPKHPVDLSKAALGRVPGEALRVEVPCVTCLCGAQPDRFNERANRITVFIRDVNSGAVLKFDIWVQVLMQFVKLYYAAEVNFRLSEMRMFWQSGETGQHIELGGGHIPAQLGMRDNDTINVLRM